MAKQPLKQQPEDVKDHTLAEVRALARILRQHELTELEVERNGTRVRLSRASGVAPAAFSVAAPLAAPASAGARELAEEQPDDGSVVITSPFVGTFYRAPSPESPPFVEAGQTVTKGTTLCIVEAMKLMNEIEAEVNCRIVEILVKNGDAVEFGQPLFKVLPA